MSETRIGFIGLGIMGKPMARNLMKAGYFLTVHDVDRGPVKDLVTEGAEEAFSSKEVAQKNRLMITMLPNSPHVREVVLGQDGILEGAQEGSILIDMSSIAPLVSKEVAQECRKKNVRMLDAPVSGGQPGAIAGTLAIMVGGNKADFDECYEVLNIMGKSVEHVGDIGSGNTTKLANQIIVALNIAAMSEALVLGTKAGVDPERIYKAIRGGLAGSNVLDAKAPLVFERQFEPGFRINLHTKDLSNVLETAHELQVPVPLTGIAMEIMQSMRADGKGNWDHGGLIAFYEKLAHVEVKRCET